MKTCSRPGERLKNQQLRPATRRPTNVLGWLNETYGSSDWTRAHEPRAGPVQDTIVTPISERLIERVRDALARQEVDFAPQTVVHLEPAAQPSLSGLRNQRLAGASEWNFGVSRLRSCDHPDAEIIIAPITTTSPLKPRSGLDERRHRITIDIAPPVEDGPTPRAYDLDVAWLDADYRLHVSGADTMCVAAGGRWRTISPEPARVAFHGDPWRERPPLDASRSSSFIDSATVIEHHIDDRLTIFALHLQGWLIALDDLAAVASPVVRLRNSETNLCLHAPLTGAARQDVLDELKIDYPLDNGYTGAVRLSTLRPGVYDVDVGREIRGSVAFHRIGRIEIVLEGRHRSVHPGA